MRVRICMILLIFTSPALAQKVDIEGHRGARGMMPENSIPAFIYALDQGVTTLEMDVVITRDRRVLVSHEPWMNAEICYGPDAHPIKDDKDKYNIYQLTYDEIKNFDCGSKLYENFPHQEKMFVNKPLLSDVIKTVERYMKGHTQYEVNYNIEIKTVEKGDNVFHPDPQTFSDLVHAVIDDYLPWNRIIIQSFDFRVLQYWNNKYPDVRLAALIENDRSVDTNLGALGFTPEIYSPYYKLITKKSVKDLHDRGIQVIPWTVNEKSEMQEMVSWEVDGLITDYPNRARELGYTVKRKN